VERADSNIGRAFVETFTCGMALPSGKTRFGLGGLRPGLVAFKCVSPTLG
jgi:hypothetical protein